MNLPIACVRDPADRRHAAGGAAIDFVTTSAGWPTKYTPVLKEAGNHGLPRRFVARGSAKEAVDVGSRCAGGGRAARARGCEAAMRSRRWCCFPHIVRQCGCTRSLLRAESRTGSRWPRRSPSGRRGCRWGHGCWPSAESAGPPQPEAGGCRRQRRRTRCCSTGTIGQSFRVLRTKTAESIEWSAEGDPVSRLLGTFRGSEIYQQGQPGGLDRVCGAGLRDGSRRFSQ